jgi:prefoldin subunit 5
MEERLAELKAEFEKGQQHMQNLDQQRAELRDTLLRISGAIQVLEELLKQDGAQRDHQNTHREGVEALL